MLDDTTVDVLCVEHIHSEMKLYDFAQSTPPFVDIVVYKYIFALTIIIYVYATHEGWGANVAYESYGCFAWMYS